MATDVKPNVHYTRWSTPKCVASLRDPFPRHLCKHDYTHPSFKLAIRTYFLLLVVTFFLLFLLFCSFFLDEK